MYAIKQKKTFISGWLKKNHLYKKTSNDIQNLLTKFIALDIDLFHENQSTYHVLNETNDYIWDLTLFVYYLGSFNFKIYNDMNLPEIYCSISFYNNSFMFACVEKWDCIEINNNNKVTTWTEWSKNQDMKKIYDCQLYCEKLDLKKYKNTKINLKIRLLKGKKIIISFDNNNHVYTFKLNDDYPNKNKGYKIKILPACAEWKKINYILS